MSKSVQSKSKTLESTFTRSAWRRSLHEIIFEADTPGGKIFDVLLLVAIVLSVLVVILDSVQMIHIEHKHLLWTAEWIFTILFSIEYLLRLICVRKPLRYAVSFFGVVDLLAIVPTYLSLLVTGTQSMMVVRALRLLRIFRVFKLARLLSEATSLRQAIRLSLSKIAVFIVTVLITVVIIAAAMYLIEGSKNDGLRNIPTAIYWAIVTITTLGYGDIVPLTVLGKALTALLVILGYSLIIVPTGILSAELTQKKAKTITTQHCPDCSQEGHDSDATHCKFCGGKL